MTAGPPAVGSVLLAAALRSVAFVVMKSTAARLIGAKTSQRSGSAAWSRKRSATVSRTAPRRASAISAQNSPSRPLKSATRSPALWRMTVCR